MDSGKFSLRRTRPPVVLSPISAKAEEYDLLQEYELLKKVPEGLFNQNEKLLLGDVKQNQEIYQTNTTLRLQLIQLQNKNVCITPKKHVSLKRIFLEHPSSIAASDFPRIGTGVGS